MTFLYIVILAALLKQADAASNCYSGTDPPLCSASSCNGYCFDENGCTCNDDITLCIPTVCNLRDLTQCCPSGLYWNSTNSCCSDTLICTPQCFSDEICARVSKTATCVCNEETYLGKKISDLVPSVSCETNAMEISVDMCLLQSLGYDYNNIHLNEISVDCANTFEKIINNKRTKTFQSRTESGWCGNIMTIDSSKVYYKNSLHIGVQNKTLITVNPIIFNYTCSYNLSMQTVLNYTINPVSNIVYLQGPNGTGSYPLTMAAYKDQFSTLLKNDELVTIGSDIYLGLFISNAEGTVFSLRVVECSASPTSSSYDSNSVKFVTGGCSTGNDIYSEIISNGQSLEARMKISSFKFQGYDNVYIFCKARLCPKTGNCSVCNLGEDMSRSGSTDTKETMININLEDKINYSSSESHKALYWTLLAGFLFALLKLY